MKAVLLIALGLFVAGGPVFGLEESRVTLDVKHKHFLGSGHGQLTLDEEGITYNSEKDQKHFRAWAYTDIQEIKIVSPTRLKLMTYEDVWWKIDSERSLEFELLDGQISQESIRFLRQKLPSAVVSAVFSKPNEELFRIPSKHSHTPGGGCHGELVFTNSGIYYNSLREKHSRFWPLSTVQSVGRRSDRTFRVTVREQNYFGANRNFQFKLKQPMDERAYDLLWRMIHEPENWLSYSRLVTDDKTP